METPSLYKNIFLYECEDSWNKIMKGIKILVFKSFNIVFVKSMVGEWCEILIIHKQYKNEKIFMQKKKT